MVDCDVYKCNKIQSFGDKNVGHGLSGEIELYVTNYSC